MLSYGEFAKQWSSLHGNTATTGIVGGWLRISYRMARVACTLRISSNMLTYFGVLFALFTAIASTHWSAPLFLILSLVCDGIDGSVAILSKSSSSWGATLDAVADRISEALWAVAFYRLGVPLSGVLALASFAAFQEYARAKLISSGVQDIGLITPAERPVRASYLFLAMIAWHLEKTHEAASIFALILAVQQAISFVMVIRFAFSRLR